MCWFSLLFLRPGCCSPNSIHWSTTAAASHAAPQGHFQANTACGKVGQNCLSTVSNCMSLQIVWLCKNKKPHNLRRNIIILYHLPFSDLVLPLFLELVLSEAGDDGDPARGAKLPPVCHAAASLWNSKVFDHSIPVLLMETYTIQRLDKMYSI